MAVQARIERDIQGIKFDASVYRGEQPFFTPMFTSTDYFFEGEPIDVDAMLAEAPELKPEGASTAKNLAQISSTDPVLRELLARSMVKRDLGGGRFAVHCPCADEHSGPSESETATVYTLPKFNGFDMGNFTCLHDHCRDRSQKSFMQALELEHAEVRAKQTHIEVDHSALIQKSQEKQQEQEQKQIDEWAQKLKALRPDMRKMLMSKPKTLEFLIEDRVLAGRGFLITGLGGSSKSRMLYHLAIATAIGRLPWDWKVCKQGKSVLFLTEDTSEDLHRTLYYMAQELKLTPHEYQKVIENVIPLPLAGELFHMLELQGQEIRRSALFDAVVDYINELGDVQFIGLDPALSLTQGDELNQGHQRALGQIADHLGVLTGAACGMVSHAAKGISSKEDLDSHNSRGGGAITDAVRAEITMRTMTPDEARKAKLEDVDQRHYYVQVAVTKANHLPPDAKKSLWLRRAQGGALVNADIEIVNQAAPGLSRAALACFDVLVEMCKVHVPKFGEWQDECDEYGYLQVKSSPEGKEGAKKKLMQRIKDDLAKAGYIKAGFTRGVWMPADDMWGTNEKAK
jgi:RecA-family ATPase